MGSTEIEWTDSVWNPLRGCSRVSEGCRNCYAEGAAHRFGGPGGAYDGLTTWANGHATWTGEIRFAEDMLLAPMTMRRPQRIFVNSMSDLFHEKAPDEWLDKIFAVMAQCPQHTFQILTKRPARMKEYFLPAKYQQSNGRNQYRLYHIAQAAKGLFGTRDDRAVAAQSRLLEGEVPNIHLGVSCENQAAADERIPILLQTPAAVRFISAEPLLGALNIESYLSPGRPRQPASPALNTHGQTGSERHQAPGCDALADAEAIAKKEGITRQGANLARVEIGLDWVIVGGESGSNARPCDLAWIKGIVDQCKTAGVACFVKQMGTHPYFGGTLDDPDMVIFPSDRKGGVITEFPASLQVREFPKDVRNSIQQNGGSILIHDAPPPAS